jgi:hypothetical protein
MTNEALIAGLQKLIAELKKQNKHLAATVLILQAGLKGRPQ